MAVWGGSAAVYHFCGFLVLDFDVYLHIAMLVWVGNGIFAVFLPKQIECRPQIKWLRTALRHPKDNPYPAGTRPEIFRQGRGGVGVAKLPHKVSKSSVQCKVVASRLYCLLKGCRL